jgi:hypothetical protein
MVFGIWATLDAHPDRMVFQVNIMSIFNTISCKAIFQEFRTMGDQSSQLFPFVRSFYGL